MPARLTLLFVLWVGMLVPGLAASTGLSAAPIAPPTKARIVDLIVYTSDQQATGATGVPLVQVKLNDSTTGTFLVDTGSSDCAVTDTMAALLGLTPHLVKRAASPLIMDGAQAQAVPLTISLGNFRFPHFETLVIKSKRVETVFGHPIDGIIGANLLEHFAVAFKPSDHLMELMSPGGLSAAERTAWGLTQCAALPLTRMSNGTFWTKVGLAASADDVTGSQALLMIDSGAAASILPTQNVQDLGLAPIQAGISVSFGAGSFIADLTSVPYLFLGARAVSTDNSAPLTERDTSFYYPATIVTGEPPRVLGMNVLSGYTALLDFPSAMLYLQQPSPN